MKKYLCGLLCLVVLFACEEKIEPIQEQTIDLGSLNFSQYVAAGGSYTAGVANANYGFDWGWGIHWSGLYANAQNNSFPLIIASQVNRIISPLVFTQHIAPGKGSGHLALSPLGVLEEEVTDPSFSIQPAVEQFPFNNMGVPGMVMDKIDVSVDYERHDRHFARMIPKEAGPLSYLEALEMAEPTFFTCWMGNEDLIRGVFSYNPANELISPNVFREKYEALVKVLSSDSQVQGVIATLPSIIATPAFTTLLGKWQYLNEKHVSDLVSRYECTNARLTQWNDSIVDAEGDLSLLRELLEWREGAGGYFEYPVVEDPLLTEVPNGDFWCLIRKDRFLKEGELTYLHNDIVLGVFGMYDVATVIGPYNYLSIEEIALIESHRSQYNDIIRNIAANNPNIALWDADKAFEELRQSNDSGLIVKGLIEGSIYSLDGISLTPRGNAWVANQFIKTINESFETAIPEADVYKYGGLDLP